MKRVHIFKKINFLLLLKNDLELWQLGPSPAGHVEGQGWRHPLSTAGSLGYPTKLCIHFCPLPGHRRFMMCDPTCLGSPVIAALCPFVPVQQVHTPCPGDRKEV